MTTQHLNHFGVVQGRDCDQSDQGPNVRFPASARCNQLMGKPGSIARRIMTSNWTSLFVAGLLLFVTTQIAAEEHAVLGQGNVSCGSWLNDRKGEDAVSSRIAWVLGYVTGFNQYGSKPEGDVTGGKGTEEIMTWIDNYCGRHPGDNLYRASAALVDELRQNIGR
jgi:hypothetical protein